MIDTKLICFWNEIEHDIYEENGHIFGMEVDLSNNHVLFYHKTVESDHEYYQYLSDDVIEAAKRFNWMLEEE